jgi:hypothetical protein
MKQSWLAGLVLLALPLTALAQPSREQRWAEDLDFYFRTLEQNHPFLRTKPAGWDDSVAALRARVSTLGDAQILVEANQITARLGDAHTWFYYSNANGFRFLPLRLRWLADGFYAVNAGGRALPALGRKIRAIQERPIEEVFARLREVQPHENLSWARQQVPLLMVSPEALHAVGLLASVNDPVRFELEDRAPVDVVLEATPLSAFPRRGRSVWPLNERSPALYYWYEYLADHRALYIKYNVCREDPALPMAEFGRELLETLRREKPEKIVFDFRHNGGGDESVLLGLLQQLGEALQAGDYPFPAKGAYAIITRGSFSSAVANAVTLKESGVTLVGEPTGGKPSSPGNVVSYALPHSRASFQVSTRVFTRPGYETVESLRPDLSVDPTLADLAAERDPFLALILAR